MTQVPYRGAGPAFNDLILGRVDVMINFTSSSLPLVRQGLLRALAVTTARRLSVAPEVPTMAEAGVAGVEVSSWSGFFVPAGTPQQIIRACLQLGGALRENGTESNAEQPAWP